MSYRLLSLFSGFISLILFLFFAYSFLLTGNSSQNELSSMHENMANEIYDPEIGSINSLQALKKKYSNYC